MSKPRPRFTWPSAVTAFARGEQGSAVTEFVLVFPLLIWAWVATFLYWDVYRAINLAQKASFTVSDNLSRSAGHLTPAYVNGLEQLLSYLSEADSGVSLRVTSITWNATTLTHEVAWSYSPAGKMPALTTQTLVPLRPRLPTLVEFETVLLIETSIAYVPPLNMSAIADLNIGIGPRTISEFIVTRPRFVSRVCLSSQPCV